MAGALNAESFIERIFSCAGVVMDEGNTLLSDDYLEKLTLLRINNNKKFMGSSCAPTATASPSRSSRCDGRPCAAADHLALVEVGGIASEHARPIDVDVCWRQGHEWGRPPTPWTPSSRV